MTAPADARALVGATVTIADTTTLPALTGRAGTDATVTGYQSHGAHPYLRYTLNLADGGRAVGTVPGRDFTERTRP